MSKIIAVKEGGARELPRKGHIVDPHAPLHGEDIVQAEHKIDRLVHQEIMSCLGHVVRVCELGNQSARCIPESMKHISRLTMTIPIIT